MQMLEVRDIQHANSEVFELKVEDFEIRKGEIISLIGPNGSGKSTWLRLISRLVTPEAGEIILDGRDIKHMKQIELAKKLAMLPQMHDHQLDLTVEELVEYGRYPHRGNYRKLTAEDHEIINWALDASSLTGYRNRLLSGLSGGERQRAWIAMAIAQRPQILLLDEPTTYLDISHQLEVMELVQNLNSTYGVTVVMVLHDINQAARYSNRLVVLKDGTIEYDGIPQCVLCKEMFRSIFKIETHIGESEGVPYFTPLSLRKETYI